MTEPDLARREPELAVLSVQAHGRGPRGLEVALAALAGAEAVQEERAVRCCDLVYLAAGAVARRHLEELMDPGSYPFRSPFARKSPDKGRAEGRAEGRVAALRRVLEARRLSLSEEQEARLAATTDTDVLDRWIERAVVAERTDQIFGPGE